MVALLGLVLAVPTTATAGSASSTMSVTATVVPVCTLRGQSFICTKGVARPQVNGPAAPSREPQPRVEIREDRRASGAAIVTVNY